ncbi:MAG: hypothetical protein L6Q95_02945 [Planctomycetes bacterium]|nr:hypothetical protein [Planctomycetota bacterium]
MTLSEVNHESTEAEFFRQEGSVNHLVREAVQNSLDAARSPGRTPAVVRFRVCPRDRESRAGSVSPWLRGLQVHLRHVLRSKASIIETPMSFIAIEDSGTRGLCGNVRAARQRELGDGHEDFFYFFRNVGISGKKSGRGSFGLGKAVYAASSRIRAFFALTRRADDGSDLLMGQCAIGIHQIGDKQFDAYGYFGKFGARDDPNFALPLEDQEIIQEFQRSFGIQRVEPGTSLVIPWPVEDFDGDIADELAASALWNYVYPLVAGSLEIKIEAPGGSYAIAKATIDDVIDRMNWIGRDALREKIVRLVAGSRRALSGSEPVRLMREDNLRARWDEVAFPQGASADDCRRTLDQSGAMALEVPVRVRPTAGEAVDSSFRVYLYKERSGDPNLFAFIREGLLVSDQRGPSGSGYTGLIVVDDEPLANLLRDAENPAHLKWHWNAERLKSNYIGGADRVKLVASAPAELLRRLLGSTAEVDVDLLADLFPDPDAAGTTSVTGGPGKKGRASRPTIELPPSQPRPLRLAQIDRGFTISRVPDVATPADILHVDVAYDCFGANPFKAYEPYDFDLADKTISCEIEHGQILERSGNSLRVRVDGEEFRLRVTGFEANRDVVVKHRWVQGSEGR